MSGIVLVGTGDHARVVADVARSAGIPVDGFVEPEAGRRQSSVDPVLGDMQRQLGWLGSAGSRGFAVAIGATEIRRASFIRGLDLGLTPVALVHPTAVLLGDAEVGGGSQVCAQALVGVGARIGRNVIVNTGAIIDHDVVVDDHAFVGPGVRMAGRVHVGEGAWVGLGAVVREGTMIGAGALVAAGAVVVADVPPGQVVAGVPARPMEPRDGRGAQ